MKLAIDIGNTKVKLALFDGNRLIMNCSITARYLQEEINKLCKDYPIAYVIISSVTDLNVDYLIFDKSVKKVVKVDNQTIIPFINGYNNLEKIGADRICLVAGAGILYPKKNVLVIDAGTCITYDLMTDAGKYLGGAISPGVDMRYKALNHFTAKLPLIKKERTTELIGDTTRSCMHIGVYQSVVFEIDGYINAIKNSHKDLVVILSGGDAHFLANDIINYINVNPFLIMIGLNYILEHNIK